MSDELRRLAGDIEAASVEGKIDDCLPAVEVQQSATAADERTGGKSG
jgi:hypothetical protein